MDWFITTTIWYLYLFIIGIIFAPLAKKIFSPFYDNGYPFAKTLGILITSYVVLLLGLIRVLPFTRGGILFLLLVFAFLFYFRLSKFEWPNLRSIFSKKFLIFGIEEVLFFVSLIALTFVRGQEPSIRGLEKFMDFGFMQSILRSEYFPPLDMWLSADPDKPNGYPINYYYFGHLTGSLLIKLSGVMPAMGYNLVLATIFAQGMTLIFSLSANIVYLFQKYILKYTDVRFISYVVFGFIGSLLVNLGGNLHTIYLFTNGYPNEKPIPFWTIFQSGADIAKSMNENNLSLIDAVIRNSGYWYPNATRFIPFTIHEFPSYSYVVADLHGHVFDIPFVMLTFAIMFCLFIRHHFIRNEKNGLKHGAASSSHKKFTTMLDFFPYVYRNALQRIKNPLTYKMFNAVVLGFLIAIHYMTNAFDGPIYLLLTITVFFFLYRLSFDFFFYTAVTTASFIIFSRPFSFFFTPFVSGVGVNCSMDFMVKMEKLGFFLFEKGNCQVTEIWMMGIIWGFFWISALLFITLLLMQNTFLPASSPLKKINPFDSFMLLIFAFGTFLIFIPEFFYIKDIYPAHFRANTMFKLGYQAFIMMGIASLYVLYRIKVSPLKSRFVLKAIYFFFFGLIIIYPYFAFPSYYPGLFDPATYKKAPELDGSKWLDRELPADKEIINYFNNEVTGQPVILEAQGDSYTDYERVSSYTGLPTVAGWWVHEWLWRGSPDVVGNRIPDISNMYESEDLELTKKLLKKYNVKYVVVSGLEKSKYPNLREDKFSKIGLKIFQSSNGSGALYRVN